MPIFVTVDKPAHGFLSQFQGCVWIPAGVFIHRRICPQIVIQVICVLWAVSAQNQAFRSKLYTTVHFNLLYRSYPFQECFSSFSSSLAAFFARNDSARKANARTKSPYAMVLDTEPVTSMIIPNTRNMMPKTRYLLACFFILIPPVLSRLFSRLYPIRMPALGLRQIESSRNMQIPLY